ncbi:MAG: hypothetical protein ACLUEQ_03565 [Cloacibacillus evryensis]
MKSVGPNDPALSAVIETPEGEKVIGNGVLRLTEKARLRHRVRRAHRPRRLSQHGSRPRDPLAAAGDRRQMADAGRVELEVAACNEGRSTSMNLSAFSTRAA